MSLLPDRPQSIGRVVDTSLELFKLIFRRLWWLFIPVAILNSIPGVYSLLSAPTHTLQGMQAAQGTTYYISVVVLSLADFWVYGVVTLCAVALARDEEPLLGKIMLQALRKWPLQVVVSICVGIAVIFGMFLFLVPGLILSVSLMLSYVTLLLEDRGPFAAIARSHRLIWGNWWRVFAIVSVVMTVWMVFYVVAAMVAGAIGVFSSGDVVFRIFVVSSLAGVILNIVTIPLLTTSFLAVYWDVKLRKEGDDLSERIDALAAPAG
jgi:hypothetical protein